MVPFGDPTHVPTLAEQGGLLIINNFLILTAGLGALHTAAARVREGTRRGSAMIQRRMG